MFPNTSIETLQNSYANKQGNVSEVVDELIGGWDGQLEDYFPDFETMMENIDADEPLNLAEHLQKLAPTKITPQRLSVDRGSLFKDSVSFFKKSSFDFDSPVKIVFENEPAIDGGGPRREYFTLLLNCLVSPSNFVRLFEGSEARLLPMHNTDALRASLYKVAGRIIATSIFNGGPGFPFLSPAIYSYLISGLSQDIDIVKEDIADIDIRDIVTQIDSLDNFENIPDQILDALVETGFTKKITKENKLEAITSIMLNTVILMRKAELDQFGQGLGPILNEAQKHPDVFKPLFVHCW
ncbi:G2/M phase-specific E3 ubiquitin-protein ligase-like [Dendronephthya gigantea]|uniref:G2/M phase-specific E3 ubiquitin-protein ligase-like n=1 Tax=Dendronephthya gigantea TaxID=151771 RepID=UPI00106B889C|nr:G2/M phase-specific E3 ubiquitin-protein ligase-like [Dendronephthya gigantea]